ncbi:MAG: MFS transporter [Chloroflexota bacterium]|nr:MAG: MFS transporter [Chloroflexota bacterium]
MNLQLPRPITEDPEPSPGQARRTILLLSACVALVMTGFGIIMPVFPRRLAELGAGVEVLGLMTTAFMLAHFIAAPFMGSLADRIGRKPIILLSLLAFAVANLGYLLVSSVEAFILVRALQGALTAGLYPSAMAMVGDLFPREERARWVGIVSASYMAGFIFGPAIGGFMYDAFGFAAPFAVSAVIATLGLVMVVVMVPETRTRQVRDRERRQKDEAVEQESFWASLPRPLTVFGALLFIDFIIVFSFAFIEPEMVFYAYDDLGWTTSQFGIVVGVYALVTAVGQLAAGPISDRFARKPVIIAGILLNSAFYIGLVFASEFYMMLIVAVISGAGEALLMPALSAYYLDIAGERHRSRVMGLKESSAALGGVLGPLLIVVGSGVLGPYGVFMVAFLLSLAAAVVAMVFLRLPQQPALQSQEEVAGLGASAAAPGGGISK